VRAITGHEKILLAVSDEPAEKPEEPLAVELIEHSAEDQNDPDSEELVEQDSSILNSFEEMLAQLESVICYEFRERALLRRALTHRSFANEQPDPRPLHNEALEFLGDAVLEFLISSWLLELHPTHTEGTLSKMRAYAVSAVNLQKHALRLQLGSYLLLNRGEEKTGGRSKTALQVDAYEALIAAIYLDGGIEAAKDFVRREFSATFVEIDPQNLTSTDYKTALQERLQSYGLPTPQYAIVESLGPDHRRVFQVELRVNSVCIATGEGTTIKGAHQAAARAAINNLEAELDRLRAITPPVDSHSQEYASTVPVDEEDSAEMTPDAGVAGSREKAGEV
jgi:ribonuclease-3